jgi:hypothetical protein
MKRSPNDIDVMLVADYERRKGKINFSDLAEALWMIRRVHEIYGEGSQNIPMPAKLIVLCEQAARIAAGEAKRPAGAPPKSKVHEERLLWVAINELLKPDYTRNALIAEFNKFGVGRTKALSYISPARRRIAALRRQFKKPH